MKFSFIIAI